MASPPVDHEKSFIYGHYFNRRSESGRSGAGDGDPGIPLVSSLRTASMTAMKYSSGSLHPPPPPTAGTRRPREYRSFYDFWLLLIVRDGRASHSLLRWIGGVFSLSAVRIPSAPPASH
jgi:hypothetical protein